MYEKGLLPDEIIKKATKNQLAQAFLACADVQSQKSLLEKVVYERGHLLVLSPKYHPELAGVGVEYCWGHSKYRFRNHFNDLVAKNLKSNVLKTCAPAELSHEVVLAFARKTKECQMVYKTIKMEMIEEGTITKTNIEKIRKNHKCHRNILDQDIGFIRNVTVGVKIERGGP